MGLSHGYGKELLSIIWGPLLHSKWLTAKVWWSWFGWVHCSTNSSHVYLEPGSHHLVYQKTCERKTFFRAKSEDSIFLTLASHSTIRKSTKQSLTRSSFFRIDFWMIMDLWTRGGKKIAYITNIHFHSFSLIVSAAMRFPTQQLTKNTSLFISCSFAACIPISQK